MSKIMIVFDAIEPLFKKEVSFISAMDITYHLKLHLCLIKKPTFCALFNSNPNLEGARGG